MIVTALLAAGLLTAEPIPTPPRLCPPPAPTYTAERSRLLRPQDRPGDAGAQTLDSLPPADMIHPVAREVAGCAVPSTVRQNVQGDGRFAKPR